MLNSSRIRAVVGRLLVAGLLSVVPAQAQIIVPGANGSDGAFNPVSNITVDLSLAPTGAWNGANTSPGNGVYDPEKWAVVFRYSNVNIPSGVTVTFSNHPSGAPVVWLVNGDVTIAGTVSLNGEENYQTLRPARGGPGGFWGGKRALTGSPTGWGAGPGGARTGNGSGSYGLPGPWGMMGKTYGNEQILPLIGGSGGCWSTGAGSGAGGGGGAILIAAENTVFISGILRANGGPVSSGGALRVVCDEFHLAGSMQATGGIDGGPGRIRLEANQASITGGATPAPSGVYSITTAQLWPLADTPVVRVVSASSTPIPDDPRPRDEFTSDVQLDVINPITFLIEAENVPTDWDVELRISPVSGQGLIAQATLVSGGLPFSIWQVVTNVPSGKSAVQVRASAP